MTGLTPRHEARQYARAIAPAMDDSAGKLGFIFSVAVQARPGRFVWLDTSTIDRTKRFEVLESLFVLPGDTEARGMSNRKRAA